MTMSGDLPEDYLGKYHANPPDGCDCVYCRMARQAGVQSHLDREREKQPEKPAVQRGFQPDGSIYGCGCIVCQDARRGPCDKMVGCTGCGQLIAISRNEIFGYCAHCMYLLAKEATS